MTRPGYRTYYRARLAYVRNILLTQHHEKIYHNPALADALTGFDSECIVMDLLGRAKANDPPGFLEALKNTGLLQHWEQYINTKTC